MKTSLNNLKQIDRYLQQNMEPGEATLFNAKLLLDPGLKEQLHWQQKTHAVIRHYGRRRLLKDINAVHDKLFLQPEHKSFRDKVMSFFSI